jgi:protein-disulfide isomerase
MRRTLVLCAVLATAAVAACSKVPGGDKAFDEKVHAYLLAHPEVLDEMQIAYARKQQTAEIERARPLIQQHKAELLADARDPFVGPKDAKVTVVQFFDYRCAHCKAEAAPAVAQLIKKYPDVRFVFKEYPIFGVPSQAAARAALAAWKKGNYLPVYEQMMAAPDVDGAVIKQVIVQNGINPNEAAEIGASNEVTTHLVDVQKLASQLGLSGTPAFIIGDTLVPGADMAKVEDLIVQARKKA